MGLDIPTGNRERVALLNQQPFVAFAAAFHVHQGKFALQLFAMEAKLGIAARQLFRAGDAAQQLESAAVPKHHAACAVVAGRNVAFEIAIFERMIFHVSREVLGAGIEGRPFGNGPRFQHAVDFEAEVVVQAGGIMALHAEVVGRLPGVRFLRGRFRSF